MKTQRELIQELIEKVDRLTKEVELLKYAIHRNNTTDCYSDKILRPLRATEPNLN